MAGTGEESLRASDPRAGVGIMLRHDDGHFEVTTDGTQWRCRAGARRVVMVLSLLFGAACFLIGGGVAMDHFNRIDVHDPLHDSFQHFFTVAGLLTAAFFSVVGVWLWRVRNVPLVIEKTTGEVRFGNKQMCGPGTVQYVLLRRSSTDPDDMTAYDFDFRLKDASIARVPSPFFSQIHDLERASALAEEVAAALHVKLVRDI